MFSGGGWRQKCITEMQKYWEYLVDAGYVVVLADYRIANPGGSERVETHCLPDCKAAIRWVRKNAATLGINPEKIVGFGSSSGGHLAACTAIIDGFEHSGADLAVSCKPNLLITLYPVMVISPDAIVNCDGCWDYFGGCFATPDAVSPALHLAAGNPPTLIIVGSDDFYLPGDNTFKTNATAKGIDVTMTLVDGVGHDFASLSNAPDGHPTVKSGITSFLTAHSFAPNDTGGTSTSPGECAGAVKYNFDDNQLPSGLYADGQCQAGAVVQNGKLSLGCPSGIEWCGSVIYKNWTLTDYYFELDVWPGNGPTNIAMNASGNEEFVAFQLAYGRDIRFLSMFHNSWTAEDREPLNGAVKTPWAYTTDRSKKYHIRLEVKGAHYKAYIDDVLELECDEPPPLNKGAPGVCMCFYDPSLFDNFDAGPLDCTSATTPVRDARRRSHTSISGLPRFDNDHAVFADVRGRTVKPGLCSGVVIRACNGAIAPAVRISHR
jgi:acetyl esterase